MPRECGCGPHEKQAIEDHDQVKTPGVMRDEDDREEEEEVEKHEEEVRQSRERNPI
jgi:hypothetical protein